MFLALSVLSLLTSIYFYFSNPRQKYTVIGHLVFDLLLLFFIFIIGYQYYSTYDQTVMTNTAFIVFTVSEVVEIIIPDIVAFEYRNSLRYVKKGLVFICLTISLFVFLIYSSIIFLIIIVQGLD